MHINVSKLKATLVIKNLISKWLNCCTSAKTVLRTQGSIPGSWLVVDSAFHPSEDEYPVYWVGGNVEPA